MAVTFVGATTAESSDAGANTLAISAPEGTQAGDSLVLVATLVTAANQTIAGVSGWASRHTTTAPHARRILTRIATGTTSDNVTLTADGSGAFSATMAAYRGVDGSQWTATEQSADAAAPFATEEVTLAEAGALVGVFSMQHSSAGAPSIAAVSGTLRESAWGQRPTFPGGSNCVVDLLNVTGAQVTSVTNDKATAAQTLVLYNTALVDDPPDDPPGGFPPAPKEAPQFTDDSLYRVRSSLSVDVGSVIAATTVRAVEAGISEDFPMDVVLGSALHQYIEALAPENPALAFYPAPVQNTEWLNTYEGETNLGRMSRVYPNRIFGTVYDLSGEVDATWTATEAITYIFERWALDHAWFRFETVPDLRFARPDQTYTGTLGQLSTDLIGIPQTRQSRQTMREIIDEWLSAFPGAVVTEDETGAIVIVPRDGPGADSSPHKTLTNDDAYSITQGPGDPRNTVNGCTVTNRPWTAEEGVSVMQPAWFQVRAAGSQPLTAPSNTLDLTTSSLLGATGQPSLWPLADPDDALAFGVLTWTDPDTSDLLIVGQCRYGDGSIDKTNNTVDDPSVLAFDNVNDLPLDGDWHAVFRLRRVFSWVGATYDYWVAYDARYDSELGGVQFRLAGSKLTGPFVDGLNWWANGFASFGVTLDGLANRYARSVTNSATFNRFTGNLLGVDGGNALQASVEQYGEREAEINIGIFNVPVDDLQGIAQAHVLRNINPKIERVIDQSAWNAFPLKFVDVGRLVELPSGEEGILVSRSMHDDYGIGYSPGVLASQARVEVLDPDAVIADPDPDSLDDYLLLDSGELWSLDHSNPTLAALGLTEPSEVN